MKSFLGMEAVPESMVEYIRPILEVEHEKNSIRLHLDTYIQDTLSEY